MSARDYLAPSFLYFQAIWVNQEYVPSVFQAPTVQYGTPGTTFEMKKKSGMK